MDEKSVQLSYEGQQPIHRYICQARWMQNPETEEQKEEETRPKLEEALDHTLTSSMYSSLNYLAHI